MKRFIKKNSRKGFTLVETLLATFILVVVSTMLINGFLATMGYSYQTSVYSKSGANNYSACMAQVASWNHMENTGDDGREVAANNITGTTLEFKNATGLPSVDSLNVATIKKDNLEATVPGTLQGKEYSPKSDHLVDNRTAVYYFPEYIKDPDAEDTLGKVVVLCDCTTTPWTYYWVVDGDTEYTEINGTHSWSKT